MNLLEKEEVHSTTSYLRQQIWTSFILRSAGANCKQYHYNFLLWQFVVLKLERFDWKVGKWNIA